MLMKRAAIMIAAVAATTGSILVLMSDQARAGIYGNDAGRTAVWVYVRAYKGEDVWETCRRVYQRDVYQVRGAGRGKARCFIDASRINDPRGKNLSRELR